MTRDPYRDLARHAERHGWTIRRTRGGHQVWTSPDGQRVVAACTPSDHRGVRNHRARLKRAGLAAP